MKYIKLFENILEDFIKKEEEFKKEKDKILKLIDDYVMLHREMWEEWMIDDDDAPSYENATDFNLYNYEDKKYINVEYNFDEGDSSAELSINLNNFLEFAKEPELHINMKKYNL